jgi:hypothetical protein
MMKLSIKAVMFSAIVFPGAGYFVVDRKIKGIASLVITIGCLLVIMIDVYHRANIIAEKIIYGVIPNDIVAIREQILLTPGNMTPELISSLSMVVGLIWVVSIVDGYLIGRRIEVKA